jgi:hypothetical protein
MAPQEYIKMLEAYVTQLKAQLAAGGSVNTPVSQQNLNSRSQRMSAGGEGLAVSPSAPRPGPPGRSGTAPKAGVICNSNWLLISGNRGGPCILAPATYLQASTVCKMTTLSAQALDVTWQVKASITETVFIKS